VILTLSCRWALEDLNLRPLRVKEDPCSTVTSIFAGQPPFSATSGVPLTAWFGRLLDLVLPNPSSQRASRRYRCASVAQVQAIATIVGRRIQMSQPASSEEQRIRLDLLVDEASMLSFPASDPPAVFVEEPESNSKNDSDPHGKHT
jgi:hypothetical protein